MYVPFHDSASNEEWNKWRNQVSSTTISLWSDNDIPNNFYQATLDRARDQFEKRAVAAHQLLETLQVKGQQVERQAIRHGTMAFRNFFSVAPTTTEEDDRQEEILLSPEEREESRMT
jgi:hypothetical protein